MRRLTSLLAVPAALALLTGCKSSDTSRTSDTAPSVTYMELANERFGDSAEFFENPTGEFVLVVSRTEPSATEPHGHIEFFVFGKEESKVTYQSEEIGSVTWLDDYHLEVVVIPGMVKKESEPGGVTYRIDARTGSRIEMRTPSRRL